MLNLNKSYIHCLSAGLLALLTTGCPKNFCEGSDNVESPVCSISVSATITPRLARPDDPSRDPVKIWLRLKNKGEGFQPVDATDTFLLTLTYTIPGNKDSVSLQPVEQTALVVPPSNSPGDPSYVAFSIPSDELKKIPPTVKALSFQVDSKHRHGTIVPESDSRVRLYTAPKITNSGIPLKTDRAEFEGPGRLFAQTVAGQKGDVLLATEMHKPAGYVSMARYRYEMDWKYASIYDGRAPGTLTGVTQDWALAYRFGTTELHAFSLADGTMQMQRLDVPNQDGSRFATTPYGTAFAVFMPTMGSVALGTISAKSASITRSNTCMGIKGVTVLALLEIPPTEIRAIALSGVAKDYSVTVCNAKENDASLPPNLAKSIETGLRSEEGLVLKSDTVTFKDLDQDGYSDLVFVAANQAGTNSIYYLPYAGDGPNTALPDMKNWADDSPFWPRVKVLELGPGDVSGLAVGDFTGDGILDVAVATDKARNITVYDLSSKS